MPVSPPLPAWKRTIDLAGSVAALPLFAVCTVGVAVVLGLTSRGPIFFRQQRVGYRGGTYYIYKFRTMHAGTDPASHQAHMAALLQSDRPMQKLDGARDARVIPGAWIIRASGLDELPQILNVLRGEM